MQQMSSLNLFQLSRQRAKGVFHDLPYVFSSDKSDQHVGGCHGGPGNASQQSS